MSRQETQLGQLFSLELGGVTTCSGVGVRSSHGPKIFFSQTLNIKNTETLKQSKGPKRQNQKHICWEKASERSLFFTRFFHMDS